MIYTSPYPSVTLSPLSLLPFLESGCDALDTIAFEDYHTRRSYTRKQVFDRAKRFGAGLRNRYKLAPGTVALVFARNSIDYPCVVLGLIAAGLVPSLASSAFGAQELAYQLGDGKAQLCVVDPDLRPILDGAIKITGYKGPVLLAQGPNSYEQLFGEPLDPHVITDVAGTTCMICYSSGTTGNPKGVEMTHLNLTTSAQSCGVPIRPFVPGRDWNLGYLPWYHMYGGMFVMLMGLYDGFSTAVLPKFTVDAFCDATQRYGITFGFVVPPTLMTLAKAPEVDRYDMSSLKWVMTAAAPCKEELTVAIEKRFPGMAVCQFYGATEATPTATMLDPKDARANKGTVGKLLPNVEARIVDDNEQDVKQGEVGELWIRGPVIMKGYLGRPDATRDAITPDGFYKTGDIVLYHNQIIKVVDRKKELIKYKSLQVAPAELEGVLIAHPDVADVGVIGVWSDAQHTELPRAYIVPQRGLDAYPDLASRQAFFKQIHDWFNPQVAHYKRLVGGIVLIDSMPRLLSGKIKRRDLRERAKDEVAKL